MKLRTWFLISVVVAMVGTFSLGTVGWLNQYERVEAPITLVDFFLSSVDEIASFLAVIVAVVYFLGGLPILFARCDNLGWKRLSLVAAFVPGVVAGYYALDEAGRRVDSGERILILLSLIGGYVVGLFLMLAGREIFFWVKRGFEQAK